MKKKEDMVFVDAKKKYLVTNVSILGKRRTSDTKDEGGTQEGTYTGLLSVKTSKR